MHRSTKWLYLAIVVFALGAGVAHAGDADALPSGVLPWVAHPIDSDDLRHLRRHALLSAEQSAFTAWQLEAYADAYDALRNAHFDRYADLFEGVRDIPYRRPPDGDLKRFHTLREMIQREVTALDDAYFASITDALTGTQRVELDRFIERRRRDRLCVDALVGAWFVAGRPTEVRDLLAFDTVDPQIADQLDVIATEHERSVTQILEKLADQANATRAAWLAVVDQTDFETIVRNDRQKTPELREMHRVTAYAWRDAVDHAQPLLDTYDTQVTATLDRLAAVLPPDDLFTVRSRWTRLEYDADRREPLLAALTEADLEKAGVPPDVRARVLPRLDRYRQALIRVETDTADARRAKHGRTMPLSTFARDIVDDDRRLTAMRSSRMLDIERVRLYDDLVAWLGPETIETLRTATHERLENAGAPDLLPRSMSPRPLRLNPPEFATVMELLPRHPLRSSVSACRRELRLDPAQTDALREKLAASDASAALTEIYTQLRQIELHPKPRQDADGRRVRVLPSPDVVAKSADVIAQAQAALGEAETDVIAALSDLAVTEADATTDDLRLRLSADRFAPGLVRGLAPDAPGESILNLGDLVRSAELSTDDQAKGMAIVAAHVDEIIDRHRACWDATLAVWELQLLAMIEARSPRPNAPARDTAQQLEEARRTLASCHEAAATANRKVVDEIAAAISPDGGEAVRERLRLLSFPAPARWEREMHALLTDAGAQASEHRPRDTDAIGAYTVARREDVIRLADDWRMILQQMASADESVADRDLRLSLILEQNERSRRELASIVRLWLENQLGAHADGDAG